MAWRNGGLGKQLSNLYPYPFVLDDVRCASIEGFLQSLKQEGLEEQEIIAGLSGFKAFKTGQIGNDWKEKQVLFWRGQSLPRTSKAYHSLLIRAYDACFDQNQALQDALFETGVAVLTHVIGKHDPTDSVLTEWEYLFLMYRLRARAMQRVLAG